MKGNYENEMQTIIKKTIPEARPKMREHETCLSDSEVYDDGHYDEDPNLMAKIRTRNV